jgi:hypothetical protein
MMRSFRSRLGCITPPRGPKSTDVRYYSEATIQGITGSLPNACFYACHPGTIGRGS